MSRLLPRPLPLALAISLAFSPFALWAQGAAAHAAAAEAALEISIPAQPLGDALNAWARQTRMQIAVQQALVAGKTAPAVSGHLTPRQALGRLLAGSGLIASQEGHAVIVKPAPRDADGATTLVPVTVSAQAERADGLPAAYAGGKVARGGHLGLLGNQGVMETPFSITSYTSEALADVQAQTVSDLLVRDPSVGIETSTGHWLGNFNIRGFTVQSNDFTINGIGGLHAQNLRMPAELIERVDVVRGPSSFASGITPNGTIGGQINVETKRAQADPLTQLTVGYTSDSQFRTHLDLGRRLGAQKQWGIRVNASWDGGDTAIDHLSMHRRFGSVGLDYAGERFRFSLDAFSLNEKSRGGAPFMAYVDSSITAMPRAPKNSTNAYSKGWHDGDAQLVLAKAEYDLNDHWTVKAGAGHSKGRSYGMSTGTSVSLVDNAGHYETNDPYSPSRKDSKTAFAQLNGKFATGGIGHQVVVNAQKIEIDNFYHQSNSPSWTGNIYDPVDQPYNAPYIGTPPRNAQTSLDGVAVADTMSWNDVFYLTLGARRQNVKVSNLNTSTGTVTSRYDASATTPLAGAVLRVTPDVSVYANYAEGLTRGITVGDDYANAGEIFPPYRSKQYEAGIKWDTGVFTNTVSIYQIAKPSALEDYSTSPLPTLRLSGEQRNRGVEWQFFGEPWRGTRLNGGVVHTQARLTRTQDGWADGNTAVGVPAWRASLGGEYDIAGVQGLSVNGRWTYAGSQYVNAANSMKLGAWHRFDIGARYQTRVGGRNVVLRAHIDNLLNKSYWEAATIRAVILNAPRTFKLSATVDF